MTATIPQQPTAGRAVSKEKAPESRPSNNTAVSAAIAAAAIIATKEGAATAGQRLQQPKPRTRFGEQTYGNSVSFAVDGQETFRLIYDMIHGAKKCVYIANYDLDPALRFVRNGDGSSGDGGKEPDRHRQGGSKNSFFHHHSRRHHHTHEAYRLQDLLVEKALEGVEVKIIVWEPRLVLRILPGADERGIDGRADEVEMVNSIAKHRGLSEKLEVRIDSTAPTLTSAHHEKIVVVDNLVGFCGGLDLSRGKWDTQSHEYNNPLRDGGSVEPWHDVHAMISGPAVWDLVYHFHQRWLYSASKDIRQARKLKIKLNLGDRGNRGQVPVVALRTWKEMNRHGGIQAWYAEMFRKARRSIYIENQFPFQNSFATRLLEKRLQEEPALQVIVVSPMEPNLPGLIGSILSKMSVNDVKVNLARLRKAGGGRVQTYALVSQHKTVPEKRRQIYVHSKVMIVDDTWVTVGSANMDKNGFRDSSELNLGIESQELARSLRERLWQEHLFGGQASAGKAASVMETAVSASTAARGRQRRREENLRDFSHGFSLWQKAADENGSRVARNEAIKGHAYYYNFEEMGFPKPYPDAKGSTGFELL